jgi:FKBP12-rapamycin complex-associated protein
MDVRIKGAQVLRDAVKSASRECAGESFTKFLNEVNRRIFELVHSTDNSDKIGGILAIDYLIDFDAEEDPTKLARFELFIILDLLIIYE